MKTKIIILAGPSGGGKTYIERGLSEAYPHEFNKLKQVTTRDMRDDECQGDPYIFISQEEYDNYESILVGKTEINGNRYGTLFTPEEDKFNTIILNKKGIDSFREKFADSEDVDFMIVMIDSTDLKEREGRDSSYVETERKLMKEEMDVYILQDPVNAYYISIEEARNIIVENFTKFKSEF